MAERKKRKDDTWTRQELSPALKRKSDQRDKKEKPRIERETANTSTDKRKTESKYSIASHQSDKANNVLQKESEKDLGKLMKVEQKPVAGRGKDASSPSSTRVSLKSSPSVPKKSDNANNVLQKESKKSLGIPKKAEQKEVTGRRSGAGSPSSTRMSLKPSPSVAKKIENTSNVLQKESRKDLGNPKKAELKPVAGRGKGASSPSSTRISLKTSPSVPKKSENAYVHQKESRKSLGKPKKAEQKPVAYRGSEASSPSSVRASLVTPPSVAKKSENASVLRKESKKDLDKSMKAEQKPVTGRRSGASSARMSLKASPSVPKKSENAYVHQKESRKSLNKPKKAEQKPVVGRGSEASSPSSVRASPRTPPSVAKKSENGRKSKEERRLSSRRREDEELERELRKYEKEEKKRRAKEEKVETPPSELEKEETRRKKDEKRPPKAERKHSSDVRRSEEEQRKREKEERRQHREPREERWQEKEERRLRNEANSPSSEKRRLEKEARRREKEERHQIREERRREKERRLHREESKHYRDERREEKERRLRKEESRHIYGDLELSQDKEKQKREMEKRHSEKEDRRREKEKRKYEREDKRKRPDESVSSKDLRQQKKHSLEKFKPSSNKTSESAVEVASDIADVQKAESSSHSAVVLGEVSFVDQSLKCAINELSTELRDGIHSRLDDEAAYPAASKSKSMVDDYDYEDEEFEDYDDDFEDEDIELPMAMPSEEVQDIVYAMQRENERIQSARTHSEMSEEKADDYFASPMPENEGLTPSTLVGMTSINFVAAKKGTKKKKVSKAVMKRRNDLINLIQLDFMSFDLFELSPVTEYNFYIKNFGGINARQVATQCNEDALEADTQTESSDTLDKWTQHPQDGPLVCGGSQIDPEAANIEALLSLLREDSQRYGSFLVYAGNLMETSFAEERYWSGSGKEGSVLSCCESCTKFNTNLSYLQGREILHTVFGEGGMMAISFGASSHKVAPRLDSKGLITVWKGSNTQQPDKILVCDGQPVTCCFAPQKKNLLFVGAEDGSVLVYDLSEPSTRHQNREIEKNKMSVLRTPTYITGWQNDAHSSPIVCINLVGTSMSSNQFFSLDDSARICIWTVVDILSSLDDDMGLAPLGRIKLVKTNPIDVTTKKCASNQGLGGRATCAICPDASVFYVGMASGSVLSVSRERELKCYRSHSMGDVTSISTSSLNMMLMLVSYSDGTLALFQIKQVSPVMAWSLSDSVLFCDWSNCRSSVFFALDSTNHLHVWDLMAMDSGPVVSDLLQKKTLRFCVDSYAKKSTDLMVAYDSCSFEVHRISPHFTDSVTSDESELMMSQLLSFG